MGTSGYQSRSRPKGSRSRTASEDVAASGSKVLDRARAGETAGILQLQSLAGNRAATSVVAQRAIETGARSDQQPLGEVVEEEVESGTPVAEQVTEAGDVDKHIGSDVKPHAFIPTGLTGVSKWHHAAGNGGKGNQGTGSADLVAPEYKSKPAAKGEKAKAWVKFGTGKVNVTRSFVGVPPGPNGIYRHGGGTTWVTLAAAIRIDKHERKHMEKTKEIHDRHIKPLEKTVSEYRAPFNKTTTGDSEPEAISALQAKVDWNGSINAFAAEDTAENTPMGPVDVNDQAMSDFYFDYGAHKAFGTRYDHYVDTAPGPS